MSRLKEFAKFASGFETFHALAHGIFWIAGTTVIVLGINVTPRMNAVAAVVNTAIALLLGFYGWRHSVSRVVPG